jgi:hypothetical protein
MQQFKKSRVNNRGEYLAEYGAETTDQIGDEYE